jgi:phospholipase C
MPFDPGHEFDDIHIQLYGPKHAPPEPILMNGFVASATTGAQATKVPQDASRVMECFQPEQVPVLSALAQEFCLFNHWHSSLPGPTWPNRFFIHAATSGGLTDSPDTGQIVAGFSFPKGTIYKHLRDAGKEWKIYHEGLPQTAGLASLRLEYVDPFTNRFREMSSFADDVMKGSLPEYVFIEPNYDTGHNYQQGNSMHPLNDIRKGEALIKVVYETLRASSYWNNVMLVITFDEHGGFYDHVPPPSTVATGDDTRYSNPLHPFTFKELGVRVPALVISAFTPKGTVIGDQQATPAAIFDHTSVLASVEKRFGLSPLTNRDAKANTLEVALTLEVPRLSPDQAILQLPSPVQDSLF